MHVRVATSLQQCTSSLHYVIKRLVTDVRASYIFLTVVSRLFTIMRIKEQPSRKSSVVQTISRSLYDRDNANEHLSRKGLACSGLNKRQCHTSCDLITCL